MLLFKEKLQPVFWAGLALAMTGAIIILGGDFLTHLTLGLGDLLALLAGFFYAGFFLATERARDQLSSMLSWWISAVTSAAALLVFSLIALALVTQVGGYLCINYALGHLPASIVSPTLLGQPVLTALLAVPLLGEPITGVQIGGGLLVLGGIWLIHRRA